eukprot:TRINITY_DN1135_c0_g1_i6.p1 TRINITY_DN1135_c0_g1~~TRINITY_DN1135_c0_g1_i6.p1  ORF type:complete len:219 (+),score=42.28 TRINITY_DN1135_c0_g1_i6:67-657(+)
MPFETQKHVVLSAAPIVFARNNPPVVATFLAIILQMDGEIQNEVGDTIAHMMVRSDEKDCSYFRSQLMDIGFIPSKTFNQDPDFMIRMMNSILHDPVTRPIQNIYGKTSLYVAVEYNNLPMVIELLKESDPSIREIKCKMKGQTALHVATRNESIDIVEALVNGASDSLLTALDNDGNAACDVAKNDVMRKLLEPC